MEEKKSRRGCHPNTIKALKDAASNRKKTKDRVNVTLNFRTLNLCDRTGNRSRALDEAVRMIEEMGLIEQWQQRVTSDSHDSFVPGECSNDGNSNVPVT